eukprot:6490252-Amphidinium_carterae.1
MKLSMEVQTPHISHNEAHLLSDKKRFKRKKTYEELQDRDDRFIYLALRHYDPLHAFWRAVRCTKFLMRRLPLAPRVLRSKHLQSYNVMMKCKNSYRWMSRGFRRTKPHSNKPSSRNTPDEDKADAILKKNSHHKKSSAKRVTHGEKNEQQTDTNRATIGLHTQIHAQSSGANRV